MLSIIFLVIVAGLVVYFMTPEERMAVLRWCWALVRRACSELMRYWARQPDDDGQPLPPLAVVTWAIVAVNVWVFARMLFGGATFSNPETLIAWGGSFGPRTTNGEWWRLVTATFVHGGWLHLFATLAGLIQIGSITERLVGRFAFAALYVAAGMVANLVCLSISPVSVAIGGSGAVFGVYGLLAATWLWSLLRGSLVHIPWRTTKRLMPAVAFFLLYTSATGRLDRAAVVAACAGGAISGFLMAKGAIDHKPAARRVAVVAADIVALVMLFAVPLRGMADVRPEIGRMVSMEIRTATAYDAAVVRFRKNAITAADLADLIDGTILPDLRAARRDVARLDRVPLEHRPLVGLAERYLKLRDESWCLRSEALRKSRMRMLQDANRSEWHALEVLRQITDATQK